MVSLYRARTAVTLDAHAKVQETEAFTVEAPQGPRGPGTNLRDLLPEVTECVWLWGQRLN